jgi:hypothetical protein
MKSHELFTVGWNKNIENTFLHFELVLMATYSQTKGLYFETSKHLLYSSSTFSNNFANTVHHCQHDYTIKAVRGLSRLGLTVSAWTTAKTVFAWFTTLFQFLFPQRAARLQRLCCKEQIHTVRFQYVLVYVSISCSIVRIFCCIRNTRTVFPQCATSDASVSHPIL